MAKTYKAGEELTGTVTGIQPYGAFVALDEETQGLVHISEITYGFVKDIHDYLSVGQEVKVKVLDVDPEAKKSVCRFAHYRKRRSMLGGTTVRESRCRPASKNMTPKGSIL